MHLNYYFLRQLSAGLRKQLTGWTLGTCFSQEKDELVLGFYAGEQEFFIKAVLRGDFAGLAFPTDFQRARKNSVDLFPEIVGKPVVDVIQYHNERSFTLQLAGDYSLLFKLHGNRSNLVLFHQNRAVNLFHQKLEKDLTIQPEQLHRELDQRFEAFERNGYQLNKLFPTFGKLITAYIETDEYRKSAPTEKWQRIQEVVPQLENPTFYITEVNHLPVLSLLPVGEIIEQTNNPIQAANLFYSRFARVDTLDKEKNAALRALEKRRTKTQHYLESAYQKLGELETERRNEEMANILMANLHQIPPRSEWIELHDFYRDQPVRIKLKPDLSAQKNAETYYRKAKNEKIEINKLQEAIQAREQELQTVDRHEAAISHAEPLKELRKYLKENNLEETVPTPTPEQLFKKTAYLGFEIWIGRNAKNNDLLTQKYAFKEDLWLHAKDVTGSHVIIKYQPGKNFPEPVIEKAASLAAYFSRLKNNTVCPVIVTPKKFVRKPKGLPDGAVVVDRENVILVTPQPWKES